MKKFDQKIAVVTGGGSGIGRALVLHLAEAGCHVALCDISQQDMAATLELCKPAMDSGVRVSAHLCDVSSETQLRAFRQELAEAHATEHIDLLFNNAGVSGGQSFVRDDREHWDKVFGICWGGVYLGCRVFMPMLLASKEAHIVNISSVNGFWACLGDNVEHTAYSAAKFAVKGFSEALLIDLRQNAPHIGISVVMPGHIGTSIAFNSQEKWLGESAAMDTQQVAAVRERWTRLNADAAQMTDDMIRSLTQAGAEEFRDKAPTTAEQAAQVILQGVQNNEWRILIGDDAIALDKAVRANPEKAYSGDFFKFDSLSEP